MTKTKSEPTNDDEQPDGVFIDVDEEMANNWDRVQLVVYSGVASFPAGELPIEPGRYELQKVDEDQGET